MIFPSFVQYEGIFAFIRVLGGGGIVPYIAVDLVHLGEEVSSGFFCVHILNLELGIFFIIKTSYAYPGVDDAQMSQMGEHI